MTEKQKLIQRRIELNNMLEYSRFVTGDFAAETMCIERIAQINSRLAAIYAADLGRDAAMRREKLTDKLRKQI